MRDDQVERILAELEMLRKLKMIELLEAGYSQAKLASALGISQPTVSRMLKPSSKKTVAKSE